jgi:nicotinate-nucleotide adenylyltransferase
VRGLLGGAFDPPHVGHVALAEAARRELGLDPLTFLVSERPGHKEVATPPRLRLQLAHAAFDGLGEVVLDPHARTVDAVRGGRFGDAAFVIGADEFAAFGSWKEPERVLDEVHLAVGTRPGFDRERLDAVLAALSRPERVLFFEFPPLDVSSSDLRARVARGASIDAFVPPAVAALVERLGLYRPSTRLH